MLDLKNVSHFQVMDSLTLIRKILPKEVFEALIRGCEFRRNAGDDPGGIVLGVLNDLNDDYKDASEEVRQKANKAFEAIVEHLGGKGTMMRFKEMVGEEATKRAHRGGNRGGDAFPPKTRNGAGAG